MSAPYKAPPGTVFHPAVQVPPNYVGGPAMQKLTERQQSFVFAMLDFGGLDNTKAAAAAGYAASSMASLRVQAYRLAHDENIQDAIREEGQKRLKAGSIMAVNRLLEIAHDDKSEKKDQLKAIEMILNRTGHHAKTEHKVEVTRRDETPDQMIDRVKLMAKNLGLDAQQLLTSVGYVDAEFVEVVDDDLADIF